MAVRYETGSSGFIGKALLRQLPLGEVRTIPHDKIAETKFGDFTHFYFLSAYGNMAHHTEDEKIVKANLLDVIGVIDQVKDRDIESFVYFSSSSVNLPVQTMYSRTKRAAEEVLMAYKDKYSLPICIIRPFSVTGVGEQPEHLIPTLLRAAKTGEQVKLVPEPVHDFIDVDDVVTGIINLSEKGTGGIFELGTGHKYSNREVKEMVEDVTGSKLNVTTVTRIRGYDNKDWVCTDMRARAWGWKPEKTLRQSIEEMWEAENERT